MCSETAPFCRHAALALLLTIATLVAVATSIMNGWWL